MLSGPIIYGYADINFNPADAAGSYARAQLHAKRALVALAVEAVISLVIQGLLSSLSGDNEDYLSLGLVIATGVNYFKCLGVAILVLKGLKAVQSAKEEAERKIV